MKWPSKATFWDFESFFRFKTLMSDFGGLLDGGNLDNGGADPFDDEETSGWNRSS
jgi:hypothetical protein